MIKRYEEKGMYESIFFIAENKKYFISKNKFPRIIIENDDGSYSLCKQTLCGKEKVVDTIYVNQEVDLGISFQKIIDHLDKSKKSYIERSEKHVKNNKNRFSLEHTPTYLAYVAKSPVYPNQNTFKNYFLLNIFSKNYPNKMIKEGFWEDIDLIKHAIVSTSSSAKKIKLFYPWADLSFLDLYYTNFFFLYLELKNSQIFEAQAASFAENEKTNNQSILKLFGR